jgi:hypothetical protein
MNSPTLPHHSAHLESPHSLISAESRIFEYIGPFESIFEMILRRTAGYESGNQVCYFEQKSDKICQISGAVPLRKSQLICPYFIFLTCILSTVAEECLILAPQQAKLLGMS